MNKLVPSSILLLIISVSAIAQVQKSPFNRVYVDEDYEYTEIARRDRGVKEHILKGLRFYNAGDYRAAAIAFGVATTLNPSVFEAQYNLGVASLYLSDYNSAANALQKAVRLNNSSAKAWHFLGFAFYNAQNNTEAVKSYLRALEIDQQLGRTWSGLGQAYLELNKLDDAETAFTKALENEPDLKEPVTGLCVTYAKLKKSEQAVGFCNRARKVKQSLTTAYYLGWSYLDLKKFPEAVAVLNDCVRQDPNTVAFYTALAEGYYYLKRYKEALGYAQKAIQLSPNSQAGYAGMGHIYFGMNKPKEAKRFFEKALTVDPESASARYNLAMSCLALKQRDCAREQYAILKHVEPDLSTQLLDQIYSSKVIRLVK